MGEYANQREKNLLKKKMSNGSEITDNIEHSFRIFQRNLKREKKKKMRDDWQMEAYMSFFTSYDR